MWSQMSGMAEAVQIFLSPSMAKVVPSKRHLVVKQTEKLATKNIYGLIGELGKSKGSKSIRRTCHLVQEEGVMGQMRYS